MIEDQERGLVPPTEAPDVKAVATDLVTKGYTAAQAKDMIDTIGLNMELGSSLVAEMEAQAAPQPEAVKSPVQDDAVAFDLGGLDEGGFDLDTLGTTTVLADLRTELANKEVSTLAAAYLGEDVPEDLEGDDAIYDYAVSKMGQDIYNQVLAEGEQRVFEANTPEEVEEAVAVTEKKAKRAFIPIVEFKKNWVIQRSGVELTDLPRLDQKVLEQHILAGEIDKRNNKYWEATSTGAVLADLGELFVPISGVVEEEIIKANHSIDSMLDKIAASGDHETQVAVTNALIDDLLETETILFSNNNSLINMGQASVLSDAIKQGGLQRIQGEITQAEYENAVMTAINTAFAGVEIAGLRGAMKFLKSRVFPTPKTDLERLYKQMYDATSGDAPLPQQAPLRSENVIEGGELDVSLRPVLVDIREQLRVSASTKNTRKFRKDLSAEKRELYRLESEIKSTVKERTKTYQSQGMKFKAARRQAEKDVSSELEAVYRRIEVNQRHIDDFDRAATDEAKLSRIQTFLKDGRLSEEGLLQPSGLYEVVTETRSAGSAKHVEYSENPTQVLKDKSEGDLIEVFAAQGVKAEDAAVNHAPTPSVDTDLGFADVLDDRQNITAVMFADESVMTAGESRALDLEKQMGKDIRFIPSSVGFIPDSQIADESAGIFKFLFGRTGSKGFDTPEDATNAAKQNVVGESYEIVSKDGKFYVEAEQRHFFDPLKDVVGKEVKNNLFVRALNPLRQLGDDFMKGIFAIKGINRNKSINLEKRMQESIVGLTPSQANLMHKALKRGDDDMVEWSTYADFLKGNDFTDSLTAKRAFEKYRGVRDVMEEIYWIRNRVFLNKKRSLGYKNIRVGDDFELGRRVQARDVDTPLVWDSRTRAEVKASDIGEDAVVMKLDNPIEGSGKLYDHIIVKAEDVNNLPTKLLNKRPGHVDRMYRDAGFTIKVKKKREVGGKIKDYESTTHILKTRKQANAAIAKAREAEPDAEFMVVPARENAALDDIFGDTSSVQFSYGASHTRARKSELLKGSDGTDAPLADITDRLERAVRSAGRAYDVDIMDTMKARFLNGYEKILSKGKATDWDNDFGRMVKSTRTWDDDVHNGAASMHNYIRTFEQMENSKFFSALDAALSALTNGKFSTRTVNSYAQRLASNLFIVSAPLFQIPQNFAQLAYIHMRHPVSGTLGAVQTPFVISSLISKTPDLKFVGRVLGVSESVAGDVISTLKSSGLLDVGSADDFLSLTRRSLSGTNPNRIKTAGKIAWNVATSPLRASQIAQESSVKLVNIAAYLAEFNKVVVRGGAKYDAKTKKAISFNAQKVTNTQNNIDQFWYQNKGNPVSVALQFAQHMNKVFLDAVLDPAVTVATGGKKSLGKDKGVLSESFGRAAYSLAFVSAVFGLDGMLGQKGGGSIEEGIRRNFPETEGTLAEVPLEGGAFNAMVNSTLNYLTGQEGGSDFTSRMGPGGFADYINDQFLANPGTLDILGPFGGALSNVIDWGVNSYDLLSTDMEIDTAEKAHIIAREGLVLFKGLRDYDKARIALAMEEWPYYSKLGSDLRVTELEASLALMSIPPQMVQDQMENMDFFGDVKKDSVSRINDLLIRECKRELASMKEADYRRSQEIMLKWQSAAYAFSGLSSRDQVAAIWSANVYNSETETYQGYIKPTIRDNDIVDRIKALKSLRAKATTEQARREIDVEIEYAERLGLSNEEVFK